jgi:hypothetical protein
MRKKVFACREDQRLYEKLCLTNRTQAALLALRHGRVALDEPLR